MKKRFLAMFLAVVMCLGLLPAAALAAEDGMTVENGVLTKYTGRGGDVTIPDGVAFIGEYAFSNCAGLTSVTVPSGVIRICLGAFLGCSALTRVVLPDDLKTIEVSAFEGCSALTGIDLPSGVTQIGAKAFYGCSALTTAAIPAGVTKIDADTFRDCLKLARVTIPDGVTEIGPMAFANCHGLTAVAIPGSVTKIAGDAFTLAGAASGVTLYAAAGSYAEQYAKEAGISFSAGPAPLPFTDVAADRWSYENIRLCTDKGLFKGRTETTFDPAGTLSVAEAVTLAARLYSLLHTPAIPDAGQTFARLLAEDGTQLAACSWESPLTYNAAGALFLSVSETADDPSLPETCTLELGVEGSGAVQTFQGKKESYKPLPLGFMSKGLTGTGYRFDANASRLFLELYGMENALKPGEIPALPGFSNPYVRFLAEDGSEIASFAWEDENQPWGTSMGGPYIGVSRTENDTSLPETCTMLVGIEGYAPVQSFTGTWCTFLAKDDQSGGLAGFHGLRGTGYMFEDSDGAAVFNRWNWKLRPENTYADRCGDLWWYPAAFYLASQTDMTFYDVSRYLFEDDSTLANDYDPAVGFTRDAATRSMFAYLTGLAVDGELEVLNDISAVPDVDPETTPGAEAILRLYRAGVLTGVDSTGRFDGAGTLTREQAAAILARVLDPRQRQTI